MIFKMKQLTYIIAVVLAISLYSCGWFEEPVHPNPGFKDVEKFTIYDFLKDSAEFSNFLAILESGGIAKTLSAYNPEEIGYTLFAPDNNAVQQFISENQQFPSLNDLLNNSEFCAALGRFHVVNTAVRSSEFPFGALSKPTLSKDYLTVSFIVETDTSFYKINNQSVVTKRDIRVSNGYVHIIEKVLEPVVFTTYEWLEQNSGYSIFKNAVDIAGARPLLDINLKAPEMELTQPRTLLVEANEVYNQAGIQSAEELAEYISPGNNDYTNTSNPFYNFVAYHILLGRFFIDDFEDIATNYTTLSEIPLNINGNGVDILISKGKQVFDSIIVESDTTIIDYIGIDYDDSNVLTQTGAIHFIDRVLEQQNPSRATRYFQFYEEPLINQYRQEGGSFLLKEEDPLQYIEWTGPDLYYVNEDDPESSASNSDYLFTNGDFIIRYQIPRIVQGRYNVFLRAESYSSSNALVEVFIDGKKVGGIVDFSRGGSPTSPFRTAEVGSIFFSRYMEHTIEIRPIIPGRFLWDYIQFSPN
ncbi:MAG: fasciclin domain-containing protein [Bacteroidales bacterium]